MSLPETPKPARDWSTVPVASECTARREDVEAGLERWRLVKLVSDSDWLTLEMPKSLIEVSRRFKKVA